MKEKPTKNTQTNYPIIRANRAHIESLFGLFAAISEFEKAYNTMPERFKAIPNGKRDIRLLITVLDRIVQDLANTYPTESEDLDVIAKYAHEQCKLCIEQNCRRCKLGKVFDRVYTYDRGEDSWAYVDIESSIDK